MKLFNHENSLETIDNLSQNYINKQKYFLRFSSAFPILPIIVNLITLIAFLMSRTHTEFFLSVRFLFYIITFSFFSLISLISIKQAIYLRIWNKTIQEHRKIIKTSENHEKIVTLTDVFYDIINYMKKFKIYFIILNLVVTIYFCIYPFIIFKEKPQPIGGEIRYFPSMYFTLQILNIISFVIIILYMIYMWYHFLEWNKKLKALKKYEKEMYNEVKKFFQK